MWYKLIDISSVGGCLTDILSKDAENLRIKVILKSVFNFVAYDNK